MAKRICLMMVGLIVGSVFVYSVMADSVFIVGNDLINGMRFLVNDPSSAPNITETYDYGFYRGYALGVYDSWGHIPLHPDLKILDGAANMTRNEFWVIVDRYFRNHPEELNRAAAFLVVSAINDAFPPRQETKQPLSEK